MCVYRGWSASNWSKTMGPESLCVCGGSDWKNLSEWNQVPDTGVGPWVRVACACGVAPGVSVGVQVSVRVLVKIKPGK